MPTRWLVGMMGAGKTMVGERAAQRLGVAFADTDAVLASRGVTADLLTSDAAAFRRAEEDAVALLAGTGAVVACGGGAVLAARNRERMRTTGPVVWLQVPPAVLAARVGDGRDRPLLGGDPLAALERILGEREALYREAAHAIVDASADLDRVVEEVIAAWATWS